MLITLVILIIPTFVNATKMNLPLQKYITYNPITLILTMLPLSRHLPTIYNNISLYKTKHYAYTYMYMPGEIP